VGGPENLDGSSSSVGMGFILGYVTRKLPLKKLTNKFCIPNKESKIENLINKTYPKQIMANPIETLPRTRT